MRTTYILTVFSTVCLANGAVGDPVTIPAGTRVFGELEQQVTSNVEEFDVGDIVSGRVWRNVIVDGQTVIGAGAPMVLQVSDITKRKAFGRSGSVEIRAISVAAVDGTEIFLDGGYDKKGENRIILSATLFALVAWPTAFIKGKEAILPVGTVFDAAVPANTNIAVDQGHRPTLRLGSLSALDVEIRYDELTEDAKRLPLTAKLCGHSWSEPWEIVAVNDAPIEALGVEVTELSQVDSCQTADGLVDLKDLSRHFAKGINRFTVSVAGQTAEVILDVEM